MCAIFGFISRDGEGTPDLATLGRIVRGNVERGPHAFGFAWIDSHARLRMYKQTGRLTDHLGVLSMARDARMLVGHLRWATHGDFRNNLNNHPHSADGGWIVHNGIVMNYANLIGRQRLSPVTECDSEALALLIESSAGTLAARAARAVRLTDGPLAMLGLWSRPGTLVAARRGNPLHVSGASEGLYISTLAKGLPGKPEPMVDRQVNCLSIRDGKIVRKSIRLPEPRRIPRPIVRGVSFDHDDAPLYAGG